MSEPVSRKERERSMHQQEIFASAEELFAKKGFELTTMDDIAKASEFAKGTLYTFFKSKDDLFLGMITAKLNAMCAALKGVSSSPLKTTDKLRQLVAMQLKFFADDRKFLSILTSETSKLTLGLRDEKWRELRKKYNEHRDVFTRFFEEDRKKGIFRAYEPAILARALSGIINAFSFQWVFEDIDKKDAPLLTDHADLIVDIFLDGVREKRSSKK
jgi:AcrR family transcriptional regulator